MTGLNTILPLSFDQVNYKVGNKRYIKDLTCRFEMGKRYFVIGPNGAGKTLLLRLAHGLLQPCGGQVRWCGPDARQARRRQAMVFQRPVMLRRTAVGNIDFALSVHGVPKAERTARIADVIERTGLQRVANKPARVLSLGEQQRLALARAWALRPQVLFLDEPTASLDPPATHIIEDLLQEIAAGGTTIIMTTHDLGQARRLADEVMFMFRGRLKEQARAEDFFSGPQNDLAQAFLKGELLWWNKTPEDCTAEGCE